MVNNNNELYKDEKMFRGVRIMKFGDLVRAKRIELGFTLREFCTTFGHDPSNWSKIERGKLLPSDDPHILETWAEQLNIKRDSDNWHMFSDLAFLQRGRIPPDILTNEDLAGPIHLFFQMIRQQGPSEEELNKAIELLWKS